jgi:hypothetical protein
MKTPLWRGRNFGKLKLWLWLDRVSELGPEKSCTAFEPGTVASIATIRTICRRLIMISSGVAGWGWQDVEQLVSCFVVEGRLEEQILCRPISLQLVIAYSACGM